MHFFFFRYDSFIAVVHVTNQKLYDFFFISLKFAVLIFGLYEWVLFQDSFEEVASGFEH